uniref:Uncharacterized protein n=1 Tax=Glossina austeni TaxID=7395 RepID=A0A1A9VYV6_GLOAU
MKREKQYSNERDIKNAFTCTLGSPIAPFTLLFDFINVKWPLLSGCSRLSKVISILKARRRLSYAKFGPSSPTLPVAGVNKKTCSSQILRSLQPATPMINHAECGKRKLKNNPCRSIRHRRSEYGSKKSTSVTKCLSGHPPEFIIFMDFNADHSLDI